MNIIEGLEKLINERGSAAIMKERLTLIQERYDALQEKLEASDALKAAAQAKCEALQRDLDAARAEIAEVRRLQDDADKQRQGQSLESDAETVLKVVCFHDGNSSEYVAGIAQLGQQVAKAHLDTLEAKKLVRGAHYSSWERGPQCDWSVTAAGRAYLMARGLLV